MFELIKHHKDDGMLPIVITSGTFSECFNEVPMVAMFNVEQDVYVLPDSWYAIRPVQGEME